MILSNYGVIFFIALINLTWYQPILMMRPDLCEIIMPKICKEFYKLLSYALIYFVLINHPLLPRDTDLSSISLLNLFFESLLFEGLSPDSFAWLTRTFMSSTQLPYHTRPSHSISLIPLYWSLRFLVSYAWHHSGIHTCSRLKLLNFSTAAFWTR